MSRRSMVKLIHADGFFAPGDAEKYARVVDGLPFVNKPYGQEIDNFNMIFRGIEPVLSRVLGERVIVDHKKSGVFRRPIDCIHFEEFDSLDEWCFIVALERSTFNLYHHLRDGQYGQVDSRSALDGWQYNYRNLFEWDYHTNILLEPNQGIFFRPWMFHSLENGLIQYYRLIADRKFRVLVMGSPDSSRRSFAQQLGQQVENSQLLIASQLRHEHRDVDYSRDGQMRHTYRMLKLSRDSQAQVVILDQATPYEEQRDILGPDILVWINDGQQHLPEFEAPHRYDFKFNRLTEESINEVIEKIRTLNP
jgi:hypothetical protein